MQRRTHNLNPPKRDNCSEEAMIIGISPLKSFLLRLNDSDKLKSLIKSDK